METYVVRVYRRNSSRPAEIVGIVEQVGTKHTRRFSDVGELIVILTTVTTEKGGPYGM